MKVIIFSTGRKFEDWRDLPLEQKLSKMKEFIDVHFKNNDEFNHLVSENNGKLSGIFVMPEYALNQFDEGFEVEPLTKQQIHEVETFIKNECSVDGLLIIPGTGLYEKEFTDDKCNKNISKWQSFREKHLELFHGDNREDLGMLIDQQMETVTNAEETMFRRNVILAVNNQQKFSLRKIDDVTDTKEGTVFIPGVKKPSFECCGTQVALYICNDLARGFILQEEPDINIVVSDAIDLLEIQEDETKENKTYLPKGMIIHACSLSSQSGVMVDGKMLTSPSPTQTPYGDITSYELEVPSNTLTKSF
ncbi:TPA: hypothetical protein I8669_002720 [Legionella pneumophila]|nr:hypothetical protein [Legionella pneumophila]